MNETIQRARDVALAVLKPGAKDLEHGLKLHAEPLVCDAYGFAPRAAVDGAAVTHAIEAGASELELRDLTDDMSATRCATVPAERAELVEAWEASGVTCIVQNAGEESQNPLQLLKRLARFTHVADLLGGFMQRAATPQDIPRAKEQNQRCFYLTGNGVPLPQQWVSVQEELRCIRIFFQLGIRMMHLTYNRRNMIGDGCAEPANAGLSDFGGAVIAEMNRVGVIPDVAHSGWRTSLEAAQASSLPVVASHSACAAVNAHVRCKPDEVIRALADTGGYIGICCVPAFLGGNGDLNALLDHLDHVVRKFGADHVAIGTDIEGNSRNAAAEDAKIAARRQTRKGWESFWPPNDPLFDPAWQQESQCLSLAWTNWPMLTVGLVQRGYPEETIRKIIGGNVLRVAAATFAARTP